ncbi:S8 family peptidase [Candidatus Methanoperedens nitratireducens]|uniref:Uncharacterized protein n=1 Tax=Candidatus Methanoperedens nitratireducens TaxID=1392998 RepID=A0A284VQ66_9EURY|nr:S8 family peptidase [Candidatus Methanoperedens nitroreducens]SNQ61440.1 conserved hypothetical protein [Candidatus Methanoperedens nitroreducens]
MEKKVRIFFTVIIIIGIVAPAFGRTNEDMDRIIIGFEPAGSKQNILDVIKKYNGEVLEEIPAINAIVVNVPSKLRIALNSDMTLNKYARYIEDDAIISIPPDEITMAPVNSIQLTPDDPLYANLWGIRMIQANYTWNVTTGNKNTIVAVIDTGADYNHEDLSAVNASLGWDFVNNDADPMDDNGHGTHVAGTVAATINNGKGVVGVAPGITIMPLKVLDSNGSGRISDIANAITYAADHGARILSMSFGSWFPSKAMEDATKYAVYTKGTLAFAAAGNDGLQLNTYPAAYNWILAVAAVGYDGNRAAYSNHGAFVDIAAPGGSNDGNQRHDILSTWPGSTYAYAAGTSMATPHASGVAALYWSYNPSLTNAQIGNALIKNADDKGAVGWDKYYGYGIIDAWPANG